MNIKVSMSKMKDKKLDNKRWYLISSPIALIASFLAVPLVFPNLTTVGAVTASLCIAFLIVALPPFIEEGNVVSKNIKLRELDREQIKIKLETMYKITLVTELPLLLETSSKVPVKDSENKWHTLHVKRLGSANDLELALIKK